MSMKLKAPPVLPRSPSDGEREPFRPFDVRSSFSDCNPTRASFSLAPSSLPGIPTGFRPKAQDWRTAPTLGGYRPRAQPQRGCVSVPDVAFIAFDLMLAQERRELDRPVMALGREDTL